MTSQKEMAEKIRREIADKQKERVEVSVIDAAKSEVVRERQLQESLMREVIADKGYLISVPGTEVVLYEDDGYQMLYCNNSDHPAKVTFLMALKKAVRPVSGRTLITASGYIAIPMPRDQFNLILASHQASRVLINGYAARIAELEKEIAPLKYIDYLIKKHKEDTSK